MDDLFIELDASDERYAISLAVLCGKCRLSAADTVEQVTQRLVEFIDKWNRLLHFLHRQGRKLQLQPVALSEYQTGAIARMMMSIPVATSLADTIACISTEIIARYQSIFSKEFEHGNPEPEPAHPLA